MNKYKSRKDVPDKYKWDLTDFFKNYEEFDKEYEKLKIEIEKAKEYVGCSKDSNKLYEFLKYYIEIDNKLENLYVYAFLKSDEELGIAENIDKKNKAMMLYSTFSNYISFFDPEIIALSKEDYSNLFNNKNLLEFKFMLDEIYKNKGHILSENEEKIINDLLTAMNNYDDISSNMLNNEHDYGTVLIDGEETVITSTNYRKLLKNNDPKIREEVFNKFKEVRSRYAGTSASLLDSYVKANNTVAKIRKFKDAWDKKLFDYNMPKEAYNALIDTVENNVDKLQKYLKMFKDTLGLKELHQYDLNLDITSSDKKYTIEEGNDLIRNALKPLGEDYIKCYNKIIDNHYIDYCEYKGKCSGGYSASTTDHDSRILLSFNDDLESISTIAHECGHNIHHQFVMKNNPKQYRSVTTLVAEVASLTNECLLSSYIAKNGKTKEEKLSGLDNIIGVITSNLYGAVREGKMESDFYKYSLENNALTKEYLNELSLKSLKKYYGNEVIIDKNGENGWIGRSHYYMNYYLYNYAFCISVASANALRILSGDKEALEKYKRFLSLGGDIYPIDAFKVLGVDLTDTKVYEDAINYYDLLINEFMDISKENKLKLVRSR